MTLCLEKFFLNHFSMRHDTLVIGVTNNAPCSILHHYFFFQRTHSIYLTTLQNVSINEDPKIGGKIKILQKQQTPNPLAQVPDPVPPR